MDFSIPESSERLRAELRQLFTSEPIQAQLRNLSHSIEGVDADPRSLYRLLGEAGVLAITWPEEYGGRGGSPTDLVVLAEEMARYGIPHTLHFITLQIVGTFILVAGTEEQKRTFLPAMARGELFTSILLTEPEIGSDLASISTTAEPCRDGWLINGRKIYNLKSSQANYALCAARTSRDGSKYQGLSLFLLPLDSPGISISTIPNITEEHFHDVRLENVWVANNAMIGEPGQGWFLVSQMFAGERSGIDYYVRGMHWLEKVQDHIRRSRTPDPAVLEAIGRHGARLQAGRWLGQRVLEKLHEGTPDVTLASLAKWHCSESSQQIGWWAAETLGLPALMWEDEHDSRLLELAYREAAGMTISGGASEVLLETIASSRISVLGSESD